MGPKISLRSDIGVIEKLMNHFMDGTTDSELAAQKKFLRGSVQLLCQNHPNECKLAASK